MTMPLQPGEQTAIANAKRGFGWEANPWVWVVVLEKEASNGN